MPLKQCCATGSLHTGTPTGKLGKIHGLECYTAEASGDPKGIIVIIPDAFGLSLANNKILADDYAKNGFTVYLPDFMEGIELPEGILLSMKAFTATGLWNQLYKIAHALYIARYVIPWMYYNRKAVARPKIFKWLQDLRKNEAANLPLGVAGFCWGGQHVVELCWNEQKTPDGKRLVDCGFTAHPSMLVYPGDIDKVILPLSIAASEHDPQMSPENAKQTEEILKGKTAKTKDEGIVHEFVMYQGAHHGFAVRADEEDKEEAARGKKAEEQAVAWFSRWFKDVPKV
ncbi:hypothetical protein AMS68_002035 [Peltaster fructicola]|uniref:Dienelactone hydrolase domain-containing protein n=1 Tax=Peltaster fructicola TaxID=286661 RepID=A0A6H0XPF8_9PEZI|nr:hypothetical protein AMS68_002035 [Peltaster fructicola]